MKRILGLDTGTNSLGWAVVDRHDDGKYTLIRKGAVIFQEGVKIEKGIESSKAAERTSYRALRRHYFRRRLRKIETLKVLVKYHLCPELTQEELKLWHTKKQYPMNEAFLQWQRTNENENVNPYYYRHICLHNRLDLNKESDKFILGRAIYHLSQRRGFLSNRLDKTNDKESGKVKDSIYQLTTDMEKSGCDFLGDYFFKLYEDKGNTVRIRTRYTDREEHYLKEFREICTCQNLPDEMREELYRALYFQRPLKSQRHGVGKCTFEKDKPRCPISHPLFEEFRKLSFINNIKIQTPSDDTLRPLNDDERNSIDSLFYRKSKSNFDFEEIAKKLAGKDNYQYYKDKEDKDYQFNYQMSQGVSGCPTQTIFRNFFNRNDWQEAIAEVYTLNKKKDGTPKTLEDITNDIWNVLYSFDDKNKLIEFAKEKMQMAEEDAKKFAEIKLNQGYASLSMKAISKIIPFLRQGFIYTDAVFLAKIPDIVGNDIWRRDKDMIIEDIVDNINLAIKEKRRIDEAVKDYLENNFELSPGVLDKLYHPSMIETYEDAKRNKDNVFQLGSPMTNAVRNPMAMRSLHQLRKVVNQLLREGVIDQNTEVHIEYSRELNDANKRKALKNYQQKLKKKHDDYANEIRKLYKEETGRDIEPTDTDILKFQLWKEQERCCIYTGKQIGVAEFLGDNPSYDIEHTIPQSVGGDSTQMNMTLCESKYNREVKKAKIPSQLADHDIILKRLKPWKDKIDDLTNQINRQRTNSGMEKDQKDSILQKKYALKYELDYYKGKYDRFIMTEVPEGFARRQEPGIGLVSRYAGLYLKSLFHNPAEKDKRQIYTIKGLTTAEFRKMWGIQEKDEKKSRENHIHHCIDAIVIACIGKAEYDRLACYYQSEEKGEKPEFEKPWETFTQDIKALKEELFVVHDTPDNMPKHAKKRVRITGKGIKMSQGDSARAKLHNETYYGAIKQGDEIKYVVRRSLSSFEKEEDLDTIVDATVRQRIKDAVQGKSFKEAIAQPIYMNEDKNILIKKVRCYANSVKNPLNIRQQRDMSSKDYKQQFHVVNDSNYCMAIYEGLVKGKPKRNFELVNMLDAATYYKNCSEDNTYPIVPEKSQEDYPIKYFLKVGTKVILKENEAEDILSLGTAELKKRLYVVKGLSKFQIQKYKYGVISLRYHQEARSSKDIKEKNGPFKKGEEYRPAIQLLHTQFYALVEGIDFSMDVLGHISWKSHA